jgi:hypothetical protein
VSSGSPPSLEGLSRSTHGRTLPNALVERPPGGKQQFKKMNPENLNACPTNVWSWNSFLLFAFVVLFLLFNKTEDQDFYYLTKLKIKIQGFFLGGFQQHYSELERNKVKTISTKPGKLNSQIFMLLAF